MPYAVEAPFPDNSGLLLIVPAEEAGFLAFGCIGYVDATQNEGSSQWIEDAGMRGATLHILNPSKALMELAELSGLDRLLPVGRV